MDVSQEQDETPARPTAGGAEFSPKPPFEAAPASEPHEGGPSGDAATHDAPRVTRGFGGRGSAGQQPVEEESSFPAPPFAASTGQVVVPPVIGAASDDEPAAHGQGEQADPSFPAPPFVVPPVISADTRGYKPADPSFPAAPFPVPPFEASSSGTIATSPSAGQESVRPRRGSVAFQEPGSTVVREPTLAESRARYQAEQEAEKQREIDELHEENKRKWRRRLIGGVAVVGIVGVVALVYIASPERRCYDDVSHQEMPSSYCTSSYNSGGGYGGGGGVYIFHSSGWFGSSPYSGSRFSGGSSGGGSSYNSGGGSSGKSSSSSGGVQRGGINPGGGGSSSS